jgi:hypothetical protein
MKFSVCLGVMRVIYVLLDLHYLAKNNPTSWINTTTQHDADTVMGIISIITNAGPRDSCTETFRNMQILTLYYKYIYSILLFTINNKQLFTTNNEIHEYNTRNNNLLPTLTNVTKFNKSMRTHGFTGWYKLVYGQKFN